MKRFRFGLSSSAATSGAAWRDLARKTEDQGYAVFSVADHYVDAGSNGGQVLAAIPALAAAAAVTERLRISSRVMCIDYHQPAVLAKSAATLDLLSDGRLELGIGAGWVGSEYEAMGIPMDDVGVRIGRLRNYIAFLMAYFSGETLDMDNSAAHVHNFKGQPLPVQIPHPPIMIGGGARKVLTLAGQLADIVSFNFNNRAGAVTPASIQSATDAGMAERLQWVKDGAEGRFDHLELEVGAYFTTVTDDAHGAAEKMGGMFGLSPEDMMAHPNALIGSVDAICDRLVERRERYGVSYVTVSERNGDAFAPVVARLTGT